jgi:3-oxoacyl-[acyl-carrier-protein] synthase II
MKIYINGIGNVSPQKTWDHASFLDEVKEYNARMMQCLEPEVDPGLGEKYLRRMSRLIRLGWIAAKICLDDAGKQTPDAIITGSGWGSVLDSEKFLLSLYRNKESLLPPTPFIQSTHNVVGAQIALLLNNCSYNMAYAHSSFAFEHALHDGILGLKDGDYRNVLTGGFDEITANQFLLTDRLHRWRRQAVSNLHLFDTGAEGSIAGEGFTFFFLQDHKSDNTYVVLNDVMTLFSIENTDMVVANALLFLERNGLEPGMIDWVFAGINGDQFGDMVYQDVLTKLFPSGFNQAAWKHLCGEYLTSTAFATWAAAKALARQTVPDILRIKTCKSRPDITNILIYNHFKGIHHSFILLSYPG